MVDFLTLTTGHQKDTGHRQQADGVLAIQNVLGVFVGLVLGTTMLDPPPQNVKLSGVIRVINEFPSRERCYESRAFRTGHRI